MQEAMLLPPDQAHPSTGVTTHCPYCAFQCGMYLVGPREAATVKGNNVRFP